MLSSYILFASARSPASSGSEYSTAVPTTPQEGAAPSTPLDPDWGSDSEEDSAEAGGAELEDGEVSEFEPPTAEPEGSKQPDPTPTGELAAPPTAGESAGPELEGGKPVGSGSESAEAEGGEAAGPATPAPSTPPATGLATQRVESMLYASASGRWIPAPPAAPASPPKQGRARSVPSTKYVGAYTKSVYGSYGLQASRGGHFSGCVVRPTQATTLVKAAPRTQVQPRPSKKARVLA